MDNQTEITEPGNESETIMLRRNMSETVACVSRIIELQLQLLAVDLKLIRRGAVCALGTGAIALCLLAGALPTLLIGAGLLFADLARTSAGTGLLCVALATMTVAGLLIMVSYRVFRKQLRGFEDSQAELSRNLTALRSVTESLVRPSDPAAVP